MSPPTVGSPREEERRTDPVVGRRRVDRVGPGRGGGRGGGGGGAPVVGDPMVDPGGGAYPVGLGIVKGLAGFPDPAGAAAPRRERSIEPQPADAVLVGLDEHTAIVREGSEW